MKNLLLLVLCLSIFQYGVAQSDAVPSGEAHAGFGLLSDVRIIAAFAETYSQIASGISGEPISSDYSTTGPFIAGYAFYLSKRLTLGPEFNLTQLRIREDYASGERVRDNFVFVNLSARLDFRYVNRESVQMYSGICLGPSYIFDQSRDASAEDQSGFFVSYQLNFFGIRFGKEWAGYAEFGFGRNGLLSLGMSKHFWK